MPPNHNEVIGELTLVHWVHTSNATDYFTPIILQSCRILLHLANLPLATFEAAPERFVLDHDRRWRQIWLLVTSIIQD